MPCYEPLRAVLVSSPEGRRVVFARGAHGQPLSLPCGRCIGCRLERARQWAVRVMHESKMHDESAFITLTYDDKHLPKGGTLVVEDVQKFLKRLRERVNYGRFLCLEPIRIRFFLCGEYGEKRGRPHYHAIIFGFGFPDKVRLAKRGEFAEYSSRLLSESWGNGDARLGTVSFDSAMYVASYSTKKITGKKAREHYQGRKPEFLLMSRGGRRARGIGRGWIEQFHGDVYPSDEVIVNGKECKPPRYYDLFMASRDEKGFESIRARRALAAEELEKELSGEPVSLKKAAALYASGQYGLSRKALRLKVMETVAKAKASLKSRNLELHS